MKKITYLVIVLFTVFLLSSCGSARVYVKPETEFTKQMSLTLTGTDNDNAGLIGELRFALSSNGFNVVSESVAKDAINITQNGGLNNNNFDINTQLYKSLELKSVYAFNSRYNYIISPLTYRITITNYQAEMVNLFTGEVVMSISFRGHRSPRSVAEKVLKELNKKIK
jgi:hypothetical protein